MFALYKFTSMLPSDWEYEERRYEERRSAEVSWGIEDAALAALFVFLLLILDFFLV